LLWFPKYKDATHIFHQTANHPILSRKDTTNINIIIIHGIPDHHKSILWDMPLLLRGLVGPDSFLPTREDQAVKVITMMMIHMMMTTMPTFMRMMNLRSHNPQNGRPNKGWNMHKSPQAQQHPQLQPIMNHFDESINLPRIP